MHGVSIRLKVDCAAAIWTALATLPGLRRVEWEIVTSFDRQGNFDHHGPAMDLCEDLSSFLQHLTKLTQIGNARCGTEKLYRVIHFDLPLLTYFSQGREESRAESLGRPWRKRGQGEGRQDIDYLIETISLVKVRKERETVGAECGKHMG